MINRDQYSEPIASDDKFDETMHFWIQIEQYEINKEIARLRGERK